MPRGSAGVLARVVQAWDAMHVELGGKYSIMRMRECHLYAQRTSWLRVLAVLLLTPAPCFLAILFADSIPLNPPYIGGFKQSTFWVRSTIGSALFTSTIVEQFHCSVPMLPLSRAQMVTITIGVAVATNAFGFLVAAFIVFPVPFANITCAPIWICFLLSSLAYVWKDSLRGNTIAIRNLASYSIVFVCQLTMLVVYPAFSYVFSHLRGRQQAAFTLVLPFIKLVFKNAMNRGLTHAPDSGPEIITFNVEVFHALYAACSMQSAASNPAATATLLLVDVVQIWIALRDVMLMRRRLKKAHSDLTDEEICLAHGDTIQPSNLLSRALALVESHPEILRHDSIALGSIDDSHSQSASVHPAVTPAQQPKERADAPTVHDAGIPAAKARARRTAPTRYVLRALQLLHMVEFIILIEYIEVIVALVYSSYLLAMRQLPNRTYYPQLRAMDDAQLYQTVINVLLYALLELASFLAMDLILRVQLGYSPAKQLAFVLDQQWRGVQAKLILWVFFMVQSSLDHFGVDFSFQFQWIHTPPTS